MIELFIFILYLPIIYGLYNHSSTKKRYHFLSAIDSFITPLFCIIILGISFKSILVLFLLLLSNTLISNILMNKIVSSEEKNQINKSTNTQIN